MRILIATPLYPPDIGGPATYAKILEDELPKRGVEVLLVKFGDVRHLPKGVAHLVYCYKLFRAAYGTDIILALDAVSVGLPAVLVAMFRAKKFVVKIVGDYAWEQGAQRFGVKDSLDEFVKKPSNKFLAQVGFLRMIQQFVASRAARIIVPSHYLKKIVGLWQGIESGNITVIYNAFDIPSNKESKVVLRNRFRMTNPTIISAGRFVPWKGFTVLMDVIAEVRKNVPDAVLEIAGSGNDAEYKAYAQEHGYHFVEFLGSVRHDTLMQRIRAADCFALNTAYEGLSHVILEAMALETPVVTTDAGGNKELFASHSLNWLAHYDEKDHLAALILNALLNKEDAAKDVEAAAKFVSSFTVSRMIDETLTLLKEL